MLALMDQDAETTCEPLSIFKENIRGSLKSMRKENYSIAFLS